MYTVKEKSCFVIAFLNYTNNLYFSITAINTIIGKYYLLNITIW